MKKIKKIKKYSIFENKQIKFNKKTKNKDFQ